MRPAVVAVDGGNSKTDVALVDADGRALSRVRGPGSSPHTLGVERAAALLDGLVAKAAAQAGLPSARAIAAVASVYLAGADLPSEIRMLHEAIGAHGWAQELVVDNDTLALLRAGTDEPNAVAVVCGAGINCLGVRADGRQTRFPSLGHISGDWGGGLQLGDEALFAAARAADGRGAPTVLQRRIVEYFGAGSLDEVIQDVHFGRLPRSRLLELAPLVLRAASEERDAPATAIVMRQAEEVVLFAVTALGRLQLLEEPAVVVLGGGVLTSRDPLLHEQIRTGLAQRAPLATVTVTESAPVLGAALLGLDRLGTTHEVEQVLRRSLRE
ncbi:N-acetylglucosamine kinase [Knoellia sp. CPCC 206450]|uniref:N-acetylglucosamine kinase n=1 Tax=Knoellia tibetensis TaxID=3404798 RepID=UPI003B42C2A5